MTTTIVKSVEDILAAADAAAPGLRRAMQDAFDAMRDSLPDFETLLAAGDLDAVIRAVSEAPIPDETLTAIRTALQSTAATAAAPSVATFGVAFNQVNERAVRWAQAHAAEAITKGQQ